PLRVAARRPVVKRREEAYGKAFPTADRGLKLSVPPGRRVEAGLSRLQVPAPLNPHARALKIGARNLISKVVEAVVKALVAWWNDSPDQHLIPVHRKAEVAGPHKHQLAAGHHVPIRDGAVCRRSYGKHKPDRKSTRL